jgi:parallel beta-helix repeat protein
MKALRLILMSVAAGLLLAGAASANTYHVATTGFDSNPGSSLQPWRTIQHAVDTIGPGDTIIVEAGNYAGCRIGSSGAAGAVCTLRASSPGTVVINALSPANRHQSLIEVENFDATVRYWVIEGFECAAAPRYGVDLRDTDFVTVQNCVVHGSGLTGIFLAFGYHPLIQNNESYSNGEHGIYQSNSGDFPTIRGNNLHNNAAAGLHMNGDRNFTPGDGIISFAIVEKNVVWENGLSGGSGINCDGVSDSIIRNNLLYDNHASGISLYGIDGAEGSSRNRVYNNTIVMAADGRWCVNIPASAEGQPNPIGNNVKNNILYTPHSFRGSISTYGAAVGGFSSDHNVVVGRFSIDGGNTNLSLAQWQALGYDQHSIIATPNQLFTNGGAKDYSLKTGSPAIDAGTSLGSDVPDDIRGTTRPQRGGYDTGCYEAAAPTGGPLADFAASPLSGAAPLAVQFADLSAGDATAWSWDFGDGATSTLQNPSHIFQNPGSFTVKLTAGNSGGQSTRTKTGYIAVNPGRRSVTSAPPALSTIRRAL